MTQSFCIEEAANGWIITVLTDRPEVPSNWIKGRVLAPNARSAAEAFVDAVDESDKLDPGFEEN